MPDFEYYLSGASDVSVVLDGLLLLLSLAFLVAGYVLYSLGLYAIAHRRSIHHPWLAWLPVGNLWLLGSISDQYQYLVKGRIRTRRRMLVGLSITAVVLYVACTYSVLMSGMLSASADNGASMVVLLAFILMFAVLAAVIALTVYQYMCCYDLFRSCDQGNGALYLIMCFLFSGVMPFLVFACRRKDAGMPPRRQPIPEPVQKEPELTPPAGQEPELTQTPAEEEPPQPETLEENETEGENEYDETIPVADA